MGTEGGTRHVVKSKCSSAIARSFTSRSAGGKFRFSKTGVASSIVALTSATGSLALAAARERPAAQKTSTNDIAAFTLRCLAAEPALTW